MNRTALVCFALLIPLAPARGQDMPLSEIIKPGEGWQLHMAPKGNEKPVYAIASKRKGFSYSTEEGKKAVFLRSGEGDSKQLDVPLVKPTGLALIHNDSTLVVADAASKYLWAFRIKTDGTLDAGEKYYALRVRKEHPVANTTVLTSDTKDRVYAATSEGIQIFDPTGRMCGVLMVPTAEPVVEMVFQGEKGNQLKIHSAKVGYWTREMIANEPPAPKKK